MPGFKTGHGPQCCDLVDRVVFGHRLDLIIAEVFSDLIDSVMSVW